jgi:hypothetical protein
MRSKPFSSMVLAFGCALFVSVPAVHAAGDKGECGPHEHLVVEKDPDEGAITKRCLCDEGWDAGGPAPPCKQVGAQGAAKPKPGKKK